jgi:outer membrane protein assembly factor BamB
VRRLSIICGVLAAVCAALTAAPARGDSSAVAFRMDHGRSGSDPAGPAPPLRLRWARELLPRDYVHNELSYPLIVGGRVFVVAARSLQALSAATGETLWSVPIAEIHPGLAYDSGRVIVSGYGWIRAYDAATGRLEWARSDIDPSGEPPAAAGGVVYTGRHGTAYALRISDGSTLWSRPGTYGSPTLGANLVFYASGATAQSLRRSDGAVAWTRPQGSGILPAALHGSRLWFTDAQYDPIFDAATGTPSGGLYTRRMPAFAGDVAIVSAGGTHEQNPGRVIQALDQASGAVRWEFGAENGIYTTPTVAGGTVYVADFRRALIGLDASSGQVRWCTTMPGYPDRHTNLVAGEGLLLIAAGNTLAAYERGGSPGCDYNGVARPGWNDPLPAAARNLPTDPRLGVSGFLGGSGNDSIRDVAIDALGNVHVIGSTRSRDFPSHNSPFDWDEWNALCSCGDAFVAKYGPDGRSLVYATLLPGDGEDGGAAIAVDGAGRAHVAVNTSSLEFPRRATVQPPHRSSDAAFIARLAPDGGAIEWSRRIAGATVHDVAVDRDGALYAAGVTTSSDFPVTAGAADRECIDVPPDVECRDAWVARFTATGETAYATYLGGLESRETATSIAVDRAGRAVVAGDALWASDFPVTPGAFDTSPARGFSEAWVARLSRDGSAIEWATTFGGHGMDDAHALALDADDRPVVAGKTDAPDFPVTPAGPARRCFILPRDLNCEDYDGFVATFAPDGSALAWSTHVPGTNAVSGVALSGDGDVLVAGGTTHPDQLALRDPIQARSANGQICMDHHCRDAFLLRLSSTGKLLFGTLLSGDSDELTSGVAVDADGDAWVAGHSNSRGFPVTGHAVAPEKVGGVCNAGYNYEVPECSDGFLTEVRDVPPPPPPPEQTPPPSAEPVVPAQPQPGFADPPVVAPPRDRTAAGDRRLTVRRHGRLVSGRLHGTGACTGGARVLLERRAGKRWRRSASLRTRADGRFRVVLPAARGSFRVRAPASASDGFSCPARRRAVVRQ